MRTNGNISRIVTVIAIIVSIPLIIAPSSSLQENLATTDAAFIASDLKFPEVITFDEDMNEIISNPERGWYKSYFSDNLTGIGDLFRQGIRLILIKADLKEYKNRSIDEKKLTQINRAFSKARYFGLKVIFRAAYDFEGSVKCEPADIEQIIRHIAQLSDILARNSDILYSVQAGFLGPWGEWHSSVFGDPIPVDVRRKILFALLEGIPSDVPILVRRPMFIRDIFNHEITGHVLDEQSAYSDSYLARTGYHNDAFLSSGDDFGTYVDPGYSREDELQWIQNHTRYTPFIAESCQLFQLSEPNQAVYEMKKTNAQAIHLDYHRDVISRWKSTRYEEDNTYDYITKNLGYRFVLRQVRIENQPVKGEVVRIYITLSNEGFGTLMGARTVYVVLSDGKREYRVKTQTDPRKWRTENHLDEITVEFPVESSIADGMWKFYLHIPDPADRLADDSRYAIRFSNPGVWHADSGYNEIAGPYRIGQ